MKVRFCSPVKSHMGYAELGRIVINQLVQAGFDVTVVEIPLQGSAADFGELGAQAERLIGNADSADVNIVNMIPPLFERYRLPGARNIGYTTFESDRIPAAWVGQCNQMDAIWVQAEWVRDVFAASGVVVPISVVGVDAIQRPAHPPADGPFRLLSVFQWSARKNPVNLIRAYCAAFDGNKDTVLTLKTHRGTDPGESAKFVRNAIGQCLSLSRASRAMPRIEVATNFFRANRCRNCTRTATPT